MLVAITLLPCLLLWHQRCLTLADLLADNCLNTRDGRNCVYYNASTCGPDYDSYKTTIVTGATCAPWKLAALAPSSRQASEEDVYLYTETVRPYAVKYMNRSNRCQGDSEYQPWCVFLEYTPAGHNVKRRRISWNYCFETCKQCTMLQNGKYCFTKEPGCRGLSAYAGNKEHTHAGNPCFSWSKGTDLYWRNLGGDHKKCLGPGLGRKSPWCYTNELGEWDYCFNDCVKNCGAKSLEPVPRMNASFLPKGKKGCVKQRVTYGHSMTDLKCTWLKYPCQKVPFEYQGYRLTAVNYVDCIAWSELCGKYKDIATDYQRKFHVYGNHTFCRNHEYGPPWCYVLYEKPERQWSYDLDTYYYITKYALKAMRCFPNCDACLGLKLDGEYYDYCAYNGQEKCKDYDAYSEYKNQTRSGKPCIRWTDLSRYDPKTAKYRMLGRHNFCRAGHWGSKDKVMGGPWCFYGMGSDDKELCFRDC